MSSSNISFDAAAMSSARQRRPAMTPERLVGFGFRGWIKGYQTADISCWEKVWQLYTRLLTPEDAKSVVGCLGEWAKSVHETARRPLEVNCLSDCNLCRDECLAVSMIAASQHDTCPALRACTFALIEDAMMDNVLDHADTFAETMLSQGKVVSPEWIINANAVTSSDRALPN